MAGKKHDEGIEFILQHWDLVSDQKKKILELLGISPKRPYETTDSYKTLSQYKQDPAQQAP